jgi:dihydroorotase-like cyclic amidohydrolase
MACPWRVATDCNPGTSPLTSLLLDHEHGATLFRMTVEECLLGVTRNGATALGLLAETGTLEAGKSCDLAIWDIERPAELVYRMGFNPLHQPRLEGPMNEIVLLPGSVPLDVLARGAGRRCAVARPVPAATASPPPRR